MQHYFPRNELRHDYHRKSVMESFAVLFGSKYFPPLNLFLLVQ